MKIAIRNFVIALFASLLVFGLAAHFILKAGFKEASEPYKKNETDLNSDDSSESDSESAVTISDDEIKNINGESFNILFIGTDYIGSRLDDYDVESKYTDTFPHERNRTVSADAIAVIRFSKETQKVVIATISGDIKLDDGLNTTLGEAYTEKDNDYFINTVSALTGLELDKYVIVNIENIPSIIDALGGVYFEIPEDMKYEDTTEDFVIDLKKGGKYLTGDEAEQLIRYNGYASSSKNSRESVLASLIKAIADNVLGAKNTDAKVSALFKELMYYVSTNYTVAELAEDSALISYYSDFEKVVKSYTSNSEIQKAVAELSQYR